MDSIMDNYRDAIGVINTFIEEPPLTMGEARTLYHLVQHAWENDARTSGRECLVSHPTAEAIECYFLQYGINLSAVEGFVRHNRDAFKKHFNRIRRECILL